MMFTALIDQSRLVESLGYMLMMTGSQSIGASYWLLVEVTVTVC